MFKNLQYSFKYTTSARGKITRSSIEHTYDSFEFVYFVNSFHLNVEAYFATHMYIS